MELRLPLEVFPRRQATCRVVFGTWGFFPDDARASHYPFVLTSLTGWRSKRCPGIGFLSRGDREIGVLRNVEPPTRPRLECRRETGLILRCDRKVGNPFQTKQGSRPSCPDQEGRRGSEEVLPENFGVPLEGDRYVEAPSPFFRPTFSIMGKLYTTRFKSNLSWYFFIKSGGRQI